MPKIEDLTGRKFDRLTVLEFAGQDKFKQRMWLCKCECGNTTVVPTYKLKSGRTRSCGCLKLNQRELMRRNISWMSSY